MNDHETALERLERMAEYHAKLATYDNAQRSVCVVAGF